MRYVALLGLALVGCTSVASSDVESSSSLASGAPSIHVRSERDGFAADVTSIVYSDAIHVRVDGLTPGAEVTLVAQGYSPLDEERHYGTPRFALDPCEQATRPLLASLCARYQTPCFDAA